MKKIMIVDDNTDFTYIVKKKFEKNNQDYSVTSAHSGKECIDLLQKGLIPDIILLDIMMPGMNGWDVFAKLQQHQIWRNIPILFLTAKTDTYSKGFGKLAADEFIEKPCEITQLRDIVEKTLGKKKSWPL